MKKWVSPIAVMLAILYVFLYVPTTVNAATTNISTNSTLFNNDGTLNSVLGNNVTSGGTSSGVYKFYYELCIFVPLAILFSVTIGGIMYFLARKNKGRRRFALYGLIIFIPGFLLIFTFGIGIVLSVFAH